MVSPHHRHRCNLPSASTDPSGKSQRWVVSRSRGVGAPRLFAVIGRAPSGVSRSGLLPTPHALGGGLGAGGSIYPDPYCSDEWESRAWLPPPAGVAASDIACRSRGQPAPPSAGGIDAVNSRDAPAAPVASAGLPDVYGLFCACDDGPLAPGFSPSAADLEPLGLLACRGCREGPADLKFCDQHA